MFRPTRIAVAVRHALLYRRTAGTIAYGAWLVAQEARHG